MTAIDDTAFFAGSAAGLGQELGPKARKAAAWAVLDRWVSRLITALVFIILARLLSPYELGLVALALIVRNFLAVLVDQGFTEAILQSPELGRRFVNTAFWTAIATGSLLTVGMFSLAPFIAGEILGDPAVAPLLAALAFSLSLTALSSTQSALLQRDLAFRELAIRRLIAQVVAGVGAIAAASMGAGAWSVVIQITLEGAIGAAILWHYSRWRPALEFDITTFRSLFLFGLSMVGIDVLTVIQQQADNFLVGRALGVAALGIYALAFRFYFVVVDVTVSLSSVALSTLARLQQDLSATRRAFLKATRLTALVTLPLFAGMMIVAPEMITLLVGDKWSGAAPVLRALCPSGLILCLAYLDRSLFIALGRPRLALGLTALGVVLRLVGYIIGVQFGVVGVAVGLSVTSIIYWPFRLLGVKALIGVSRPLFARQLASSAVATGVMASGVLLVRWILIGEVPSVVLLAVEVSLGGLTYAAVLAAVDRSSIRELIGMLKPLVSRSSGSSARQPGVRIGRLRRRRARSGIGEGGSDGAT